MPRRRSCDRCRKKKRACRRSKRYAGPDVPCYECKKAKTDCISSLGEPSKKKSPNKKSKMHHELAKAILGELFPGQDIESINGLYEIATANRLAIPPLELLRKDCADQEKGSFEPIFHEGSIEFFIDRYKGQYVDKRSITHEPYANSTDSYFKDRTGNLHFIGALGAPTLLWDITNYALLGSSGLQRMRTNRSHHVLKDGLPLSSTSSFSEELTSLILFWRFGKEETEHYMDVFLRKGYMFCPCIGETGLHKMHNTYWLHGSQKLMETTGSKYLVIFIYLTWLLGKIIDLNEFTMECKKDIEQDYLKLVKCCLSELLLTPTVEGIRCLLLLSIYMDLTESGETSYVYLELAMLQAKSIGLHKASLADHFSNGEEFKDAQLTWWTLYHRSLHFCNRMGRLPIILPLEITMGKVSTNGFSWSFRWYHECSIQLDHIFHLAMEVRRNISSIKELVNSSKLSTLVALCERLRSYFDEAMASVPKNKEMEARHILHVKLRYHYYILSLTLLVVVCFTRISEWKCDERQILYLFSCCFASAKEASRLIMEFNGQEFHNSLSPAIFTLYYATMSLMTLSLWFADSVDGKSQLSAKFQLENSVCERDIQDLILPIQKFNIENSSFIRGSLLTVSKVIELLICILGETKGQNATEIENNLSFTLRTGLYLRDIEEFSINFPEFLLGAEFFEDPTLFPNWK